MMLTFQVFICSLVFILISLLTYYTRISNQNLYLSKPTKLLICVSGEGIKSIPMDLRSKLSYLVYNNNMLF